MNIFNFFFNRPKPLIRPDFIYQRRENKIFKTDFLSNQTVGPFSINDFTSHADSSKKEVAIKNSINFFDRLFGTQKYQNYAKSVKGFYNEEKVWKLLSKKYFTVFSHSLDHHGVDILLSKDNKNFFGFQVKSSQYYAEHFRQSGKAKNVHGIIIIGPKSESQKILLQVQTVIEKYNFS